MRFLMESTLHARMWRVLGVIATLAIVGTFVAFSRQGSTYRALTAVPVQQAVLEDLKTLGRDRVAARDRSFSVAIPAKWIVAEGEEAQAYDLVLHNMRGASLCAISTPVDYDDLRSLAETIRAREQEHNIATVQELADLDARKVIQRKALLVTERIVSFDFVEDRVAYHVICSAPVAEFDVYEPLFRAMAASLKAAGRVSPAAVPAAASAGGTPGSA